MALPTYYQPADVERLFDPDFQRAYLAGLSAATAPASADERRTLLWLIDVQIDFCFPAPIGRLPVPNALADTRRTIEWLYQHTPDITHIAASLDTHTPYQIFFPSWWQDANGQHPAPYTVITAEQVQRGQWRPVTEAAWSAYYVEALEKDSRKQLMIWPYHCMEGSAGRALVPALAEAIMFHSAARMAQPTFLVKGTIAQTEYYSAVEPEVKYPSHPDGKVNEGFVNFVRGFEVVYVCGQARSHCVLETLNSAARHITDPDALRKVVFLDDCASSITGFEAATERRLEALAAQGIRRRTSHDPLV